MTQPYRAKWRPTLGLIVFAVLSTVIALPLVGLFFFRIYDNQLIHQTQAELIAQSSVLSARLRPRGRGKNPRHSARRGNRARAAPRSVGPFCADPAGARSCRQRSFGAAARCAARGGGARSGLSGNRRAIAAGHVQTQKVTLAGFRILDPSGTVIAGRQRNRPVACPYRGGRGRAAGALSRRAAGAHLRQAAAADLFDQPRHGLAGIFRDAGDRRQPCRRRDLCLAHPEQHLPAFL